MSPKAARIRNAIQRTRRSRTLTEHQRLAITIFLEGVNKNARLAPGAEDNINATKQMQSYTKVRQN